jgi:hypothetical protein
MQKFEEIKNSKKLGHFYKFKRPAQREIFGSQKRTCPGERGRVVALT